MRPDQGSATKSQTSSEAHEVRALLDKFARAITAGDGAAAASLWQVPAFVLGAETAMALSSLAEIQRFYGGSKQQYNERGIVGTRAEIVDEDHIDDKLVVVKVRWPYLDAAGNEVGAERSDYTLARDDDSGELRVRCVLMRGVEPTH